MTTLVEPQTHETETPAVKRRLPSDYLMQGWCQKAQCRDENGLGVRGGPDSHAVKWCVIGASTEAFSYSIVEKGRFERLFSKYINSVSGVLTVAEIEREIAIWNDAPGRTQEEVVQLALKVEHGLGLR